MPDVQVSLEVHRVIAEDEAVEACKDSVETTGSQLSEDLKSDLVEICEEAASGDEEDIKDASLEICTRIVEETA